MMIYLNNFICRINSVSIYKIIIQTKNGWSILIKKSLKVLQLYSTTYMRIYTNTDIS